MPRHHSICGHEVDKYTKNSFIGYIERYFFSESIFRYESVPPKRIGPVGNFGAAFEETDEKYRRGERTPVYGLESGVGKDVDIASDYTPVLILYFHV